jgi:hypothetical protein
MQQHVWHDGSRTAAAVCDSGEAFDKYAAAAGKRTSELGFMVSSCIDQVHESSAWLLCRNEITHMHLQLLTNEICCANAFSARRLHTALQGFEKTGLGERIANNLLTVCGSSSLQLAMGLAAAEVFITPAMPSTTARAAGIFMPVIKSVSQAVGSMPGEGQECHGCKPRRIAEMQLA